MTSEVYFATAEDIAKIDELVAAMLKAVEGKSATYVATAALRITIGLWKLGGADRYTAESVCIQHLDAAFEDAPKPN